MPIKWKYPKLSFRRWDFNPVRKRIPFVSRISPLIKNAQSFNLFMFVIAQSANLAALSAERVYICRSVKKRVSSLIDKEDSQHDIPQSNAHHFPVSQYSKDWMWVRNCRNDTTLAHSRHKFMMAARALVWVLVFHVANAFAPLFAVGRGLQTTTRMKAIRPSQIDEVRSAIVFRNPPHACYPLPHSPQPPGTCEHWFTGCDEIWQQVVHVGRRSWFCHRC